MAIPDPPKAGSPFSPLWTGGWNPKTPKINNFFIPEITLRGGYPPAVGTSGPCMGRRALSVFALSKLPAGGTKNKKIVGRT